MSWSMSWSMLCSLLLLLGVVDYRFTGMRGPSRSQILQFVEIALLTSVPRGVLRIGDFIIIAVAVVHTAKTGRKSRRLLK